MANPSFPAFLQSDCQAMQSLNQTGSIWVISAERGWIVTITLFYLPLRVDGTSWAIRIVPRNDLGTTDATRSHSTSESLRAPDDDLDERAVLRRIFGNPDEGC